MFRPNHNSSSFPQFGRRSDFIFLVFFSPSHSYFLAVTAASATLYTETEKEPRHISHLIHAIAELLSKIQVTSTASEVTNTHSSTADSYLASPPLSHDHSMTSMFIIMSTFTARSHSGRRLGSSHDQKAGMLLCREKSCCAHEHTRKCSIFRRTRHARSSFSFAGVMKKDDWLKEVRASGLNYFRPMDAVCPWAKNSHLGAMFNDRTINLTYTMAYGEGGRVDMCFCAYLIPEVVQRLSGSKNPGLVGLDAGQPVPYAERIEGLHRSNKRQHTEQICEVEVGWILRRRHGVRVARQRSSCVPGGRIANQQTPEPSVDIK